LHTFTINKEYYENIRIFTTWMANDQRDYNDESASEPPAKPRITFVASSTGSLSPLLSMFRALMSEYFL
jgi:hypothetical protein